MKNRDWETKKKAVGTPDALKKLSAMRLRRGWPRSKNPPLSKLLSSSITDRVSKLLPLIFPNSNFLFPITEFSRAKDRTEVESKVGGRLTRVLQLTTRRSFWIMPHYVASICEFIAPHFNNNNIVMGNIVFP